MKTTTVSSPVPAVQVDGFTLINYNNFFMVSVITVSAVVTTSFTTIYYSPSLFVSPESPLFILLSESLLIKVQTDIAAIVPSTILASPYVIVPTLAPSSPGLLSLVRLSPRISFPSQGKT